MKQILIDAIRTATLVAVEIVVRSYVVDKVKEFKESKNKNKKSWSPNNFVSQK